METRDKIIATASGLFLKMGIRNITMDQIATEAGVPSVPFMSCSVIRMI